MSALRGNPSIEEVRAQLRTFEPLLITGGDGERDSDDDTDDNDVDDDTDETDDDDSDNDGDDNDDDDDEDEDDKSKSKSKGKKKEPTAEELLDAERAKNIQLQKQIDKNKKAADQAKADKDVTKDRDKLKTENDKLREMMDDNLLEWAIGKNKKYDWADADDVLRFINTESISIDLDNKKVDGLDLELKRIAKEKPYLLKQKEADKDDKDDKELPPSGSHPRNGKTGSDDKEQQRLGQKYKIPGYGTQTLRAL